MSLRAALALFVACAALLPAFQADAPFNWGSLGGAGFSEQIQTTIDARTVAGAVHRRIGRTAAYGVKVRADTMVVSADSLALQETADSSTRPVNTDAVTGGIWTLLLPGSEAPRVLTRLFVPQEIADVSDVSVAMDDFFIAPPLTMAERTTRTDQAGRSWQRLADSSGSARYKWAWSHAVDSTSTTGDSVAVSVSENIHDTGTIVWQALRGPIRWERHIITDATTHFSGRAVQATVDQQITVRRR